MSKTITCIVLDGFHKGHVVRMPNYLPVLRLLKPRINRIDYCCHSDDEGLIEEPEQLEYLACFHAVDQDVVLYSQKGKSLDILGMFPWEHSIFPWTHGTTLAMGYHGEYGGRTDDPPLKEEPLGEGDNQEKK